MVTEDVVELVEEALADGWDGAAPTEGPQLDARLDGCPPLPPGVLVEAGVAGSQWLDDYVNFSRRWSPRAYDGFHAAAGLWVLSTVAAGRVMVHFGGPRFGSLYVVLCARTSLYTKTTTAEIGVQILRAAGLDWLLLGDAMTPQKFIYDLTSPLPEGFERLEGAARARALARLALSGARGWFYEEFGQQLAAMMRQNGIMADFRGILRRLDDHKAGYAYGTISRGEDSVERPYLALLGNLTPAELRPYARAGGSLWQDGFYARFAFVTPPADEPRRRGRFPAGERVPPAAIVEPLRTWHARLGMPQVEVTGDAAGGWRVARKALQPTVCTLGSGVVDAFYRYNDGLLDLVEQRADVDLDGNYARLAEKALRVAMLLASVEGGDRIELRHWALGQQIAEGWRADLHHLVAQLREPERSRSEVQEERVWSALCGLAARGSAPTAREVGQRVRGMTTQEVERVLGPLARSGAVSVVCTGRTMRYRPAADA